MNARSLLLTIRRHTLADCPNMFVSRGPNDADGTWGRLLTIDEEWTALRLDTGYIKILRTAEITDILVKDDK